MDENQVGHVLELLNKAGIDEPAHILRFEGFRNEKRVTIEIRDIGPDNYNIRFMCSAKSETGKGASGNPAKSVQEAIAVCHWYKLDE